MVGWISLHRRIQEHWLWKDKPFDRRSAWIDMLLLANHDDNKFLLGNELIEVKRGSFITSELKLMERWGWSKTKVRAFLNLLQSDSMIVKKSDKKKTTIIIEKYSNYQNIQTTEKPQKNHRETTKEPQKDTNNNANNDNKDNAENQNFSIDKKSKTKTIFTEDDKEYKLARYLSRCIAKRLDKPLKDEKTLQNWSNDFNKIIRLDKYEPDEILEVLQFSQNDEFWRKQILSASNFRDKYEKLLSQLKG